jgi:hypothetical protein
MFVVNISILHSLAPTVCDCLYFKIVKYLIVCSHMRS